MFHTFQAWLLACAAVAATLVFGCKDKRQDAVELEIVGTELIVLRGDGVRVRGDRLVGSTLLALGPEGAAEEVRIDKVELDPNDASKEVFLYTFSNFNPQTKQWEPTCAPDAEGRSTGFLLSGSWTSDGEHLRDGQLSVTCTSGAIGKCVLFGYKPWKTLSDGTSLWNHHQACTRMVRADYCGDGEGHTRDGTLIDVFDKLGIQKEESADKGLFFEAGWGPQGATCLAKGRLFSPSDTEAVNEIAAKCPEKLGDGRMKPRLCSRQSEQDNPLALLLNKS